MTSSKLKSPASEPTSAIAKLLLVDDDPNFRDLTARNFRRRGYTVEEADCGEAALATLEKHDFDIVILDVSMPGMTGIEVLEKINESTADTEVIMLTGETTIKTAVDAMKLGAIDYLTKPVEMDELIIVVEKARSRSSQKRKPTPEGDHPAIQSIIRHGWRIGSHAWSFSFD